MLYLRIIYFVCCVSYQLDGKTMDDMNRSIFILVILSFKYITEPKRDFEINRLIEKTINYRWSIEREHIKNWHVIKQLPVRSSSIQFRLECTVQVRSIELNWIVTEWFISTVSSSSVPKSNYTICHTKDLRGESKLNVFS